MTQIPLWIFALTASLNLLESHSLEGVRGYEVVRPIRLHARQTRETKSSRPETMNYAMKVGGKDIEMHLKKNRELLSNDYSETYYTDDGTPVSSTPQDLDHCYYHGSIVNDNKSVVSMSTCHGLRGYFKTSAQRYLIEPLSGGDEGDHAVMTYDDQSSPPAVCGVTNTSWNDEYPPVTSKSRSRASGPSLLQQSKYIELVLVADNREYKKRQSKPAEVRQRMFELVNFVNLVYKPYNTFISLVGLEVWSDSDKIVVTPPAGANLDAFTKWRNSDLAKRTPNDNAFLISGIDFEGATVGLAFIGTLCSSHSVGVVQDHNANAIAVGATLAHELGHNLGMGHDDSSACTCSGSSCIMAPALSWDIPKTFSSCSTENYNKFLNDRNPECLLNKPDFRSLQSPPVCGNGFLESGEDCDCGTLEECKNPCCNATSCTLTKGSDCATGECCEDCKILPTSRECRRQRDVCDLAEYCTGTSANCPEDVFTVNGVSCDGDKGYCYNGRCPKHQDQCVKMYGPNAAKASDSCYDMNTRGVSYAYCKRPLPSQYTPCQSRDVLCGKLMCVNGNPSPNYGRMVRFNNCKATFYDDADNDLGQVDRGTKCNDGKVCSQNECVDFETAYGARVTNCSARCNGHAVCNHKMECQCEPGWKHPECSEKDGGSAGLTRGETIGIAVTFCLLALAAMAVAAAVYLKKRQQSPTLPSHSKPKTAADHQPLNKMPVPRGQNNSAPQKASRPIRAPPPPPKANNQSQVPVTNFMDARRALRPPPRV